MSRLYAIFATVFGALVVIDLEASAAEDYRVAWILVDMVATAYLILFNVWFRSVLHQLMDRLSHEIR